MYCLQASNNLKVSVLLSDYVIIMRSSLSLMHRDFYIIINNRIVSWKHCSITTMWRCSLMTLSLSLIDLAASNLSKKNEATS
jgi:hypothetical protein